MRRLSAFKSFDQSSKRGVIERQWIEIDEQGRVRWMKISHTRVVASGERPKKRQRALVRRRVDRAAKPDKQGCVAARNEFHCTCLSGTVRIRLFAKP